MADPLDPSDATVKRHRAALAALPADDGVDAANAARGLITAAPSDLQIKNEDGSVIWSLNDYGFLSESAESPESVHPALWRLARLNMHAGLFESDRRVLDRVVGDCLPSVLVQGPAAEDLVVLHVMVVGCLGIGKAVSEGDTVHG